MDKPVGPSNIKSKLPLSDSAFLVCYIFLSAFIAMFLIGISTCNVSSFEWNTYKSKADCMIKILDGMDHKATLEEISNVESYCKRYDS